MGSLAIWYGFYGSSGYGTISWFMVRGLTLSLTIKTAARHVLANKGMANPICAVVKQSVTNHARN